MKIQEQQSKLLQEIQVLRTMGSTNATSSSQVGSSFAPFLDSLFASNETPGRVTQTPFAPLTSFNKSLVYGITNPTLSTLPAIDNESASLVSNDVDEIISYASQTFGVREDIIRTVIEKESGFRQEAVSSAGAQGFMQLMPATARGLGVEDPFDAKQNIMGGTKYLRQMLDRYGDNLSLALAAYNAGPGTVDKYGGIPPFQETRKYVASILQRVPSSVV
ncbi:lytic transglycosylase domain-containing protein [Bacillus fonticola]|uniref:lytic transglycosylase domain-containing protein n=1 Tax=Bacillus fonticola TaxID=2728853 RepID=UPI002AD32C90|nr:lytic transglycosylase domain-containing protein [Bacillus fonticola]